MLSWLTKNPPRIMNGMTKAGTKAVATSTFGIMTDNNNPYETAYQ